MYKRKGGPAACAQLQPEPQAGQVAYINRGVPAKSYAVFNFKGGAGKTTLAINLAARLANFKRNRGARVLVIDGDSQCDLTSFHTPAHSVLHTEEQQAAAATEACKQTMAHAESGSSASEEDEAETEEEPGIECFPVHDGADTHCVPMEDLIAERKGGLDRIFEPYFRRDPSFADVEEQISAVVSQARNKVSIADIAPHAVAPGASREARAAALGSAFIECDKSKYHGRLWVLRGSPRLSIDRDAGMGAAAEQPCKKYVKLGIFSCLLQRLSSHFDFIIVDLNPSSAALNKVMAMSCDYILPPCFAEGFSSNSVHGMLTSVLPEWFAWQAKVNDQQNEMMEMRDDEEDIHEDFLFPNVHPHVLPFICTNFDTQIEVKGDKPKGRIKNRINPHNSGFVNTMRQFIYAYVAEFINSEDKRGTAQKKKRVARALLPNRPPDGKAQYVITLLPHVHGAMSLCHEQARPLVECTRKSLVESGHVPKKKPKTMSMSEWEREFNEEVKTAKEQYGSLATWLFWLRKHPPKKIKCKDYLEMVD